jgi:photosystem II stability/assembly factor-like uncharacterized protein
VGTISADALIRRLQLCTVRIELGDGSFGSGFFVAKGIVVTCLHVVAGFDRPSITVKWADRTPTVLDVKYPDNYDSSCALESILAPRGSCPDVALLRVDLLDHPCVFLASNAQVGDRLYVFGYSDEHPEGDPATNVFEGFSTDQGAFKLKQGQIRPGMSGSPVLNLETGAVCGVVAISRDRRSDLGGRGVPAAVLIRAYADLASNSIDCQRRGDEWLLLLSPQQRARLEADTPQADRLPFIGGSLSLAVLALASLQSGSPHSMTNPLHPFRVFGPPYASVRDLTINPETGTVWVGTADTSVFRNDGRHRWLPRDLGLPSKEANAIAFAQDRGLLYAGTDNGLWVSDDRGDSWAPAPNPFKGQEILCIALSVHDPNVQVVGTLKQGGISICAADFVSFGKPGLVPLGDGHAHFTVDGGKTWRSWSIQTTNGAAIAEADTRLIYIASADAGLFVSRDRFDSLEKVVTFPLAQRPLTVAICPRDKAVVIVGTLDGGLWTSLDDGRSWIHATATGNGQVSGIAFSPIDDRNILAAGRNGLFESRDGGQTWQTSGDGIDYGWSIAVRFNRVGEAYVGTSGGGVYLRRNGQLNWQPLNDGFPALPSMIAACPDANRCFLGSGVGLCETSDAGFSWRFRGKAGEPVSALTVEPQPYVGAPGFGDGLHFSTSAGRAFSSGDAQVREQVYWGTTEGRLYKNAVGTAGYELLYEFQSNSGRTPIRNIVRGPASILVAPESLPLQRSDDDGIHWRTVGETELGRYINGVFQSPTDPARLYVASVDRGAFLSEEFGERWTKSDLPDAGPITSIAESATDRQLVFAATTKGEVLRSTDRGLSYSIVRQASSDGDRPWACLLPHPEDKRVIVLGLPTGVVLSKDEGRTWSPLRLGAIGGSYYVNHLVPREGGLLMSSTQGSFSVDWVDLL